VKKRNLHKILVDATILQFIFHKMMLCWIRRVKTDRVTILWVLSIRIGLWGLVENAEYCARGLRWACGFVIAGSVVGANVNVH
jgi:hypothetical protein